MFKLLSVRLWLVLLWFLLVAVSLFIRPLLPIDETRYVAVAWEMWVRNDFLVPYLNGQPYSHKPPLLFWLMQLSWWLFGVNDWSHRIVAPLFSLATLYLLQVVAKELWPTRTQIAELTPFILLGFLSWMGFSSLTLFDIMLCFFVLTGIYGLLRLINYGHSIKNWLLFGIAIGGGTLTKGPVILLHVLPIALLIPWQRVLQPSCFRWQQWYGGLSLAVLTGALIALIWAIPAGFAGGEDYQKAIFLGQTSGRVVDSFAHKLPVWWYLQVLPLLLLPWPLLKPFWAGIKRLDLQDFGIRFCLIWAIPVFVAFSLISGKRIHYLLPLLPALALMLAWAMDQLTEFNWQRTHLGFTVILGLLGLVLMLLPWLNGHYHWREELSSLSLGWGILLLTCSVGLSFIKADGVQESAGYVCIAGIIATLVISGSYFDNVGKLYDTTAPAQKIAELMGEKKAIAMFTGKYHGQYQFTGRLIQPIKVISKSEELIDFATRYPDGYILVTYKDLKDPAASALSYHYPFKGNNIGFFSSNALISNPGLVSLLKPM